MPKKDETVTITITIDENVKLLLEKAAHEVDLTLSRYARNLIYSTIDDLRILKNLKLINLDLFKIYLSPENVDLKDIEFKSSSKEVNISVIIRKDIKEKLAAIADDLGLTLKQVSRNLIYVGLHEHRFLKQIGLVKVIKIAVGFREYIKGFMGAEKES